MNELQFHLILSAVLFSIGLAGVLVRRNAILVLIAIELMLNAANLNFIAFWRDAARPDAPGSVDGMMFAIFSIAVAAAEAAVGLALVIAVYRHRRTTHLDQVDSLKG